MNSQPTSPSGTNGHTSAQDIFMLTDEQILGIDSEPQDVQVRGADPEGKPAVGSDARQAEAAAEASTPTGAGTPATKAAPTTPDGSAEAAPAPFSALEDVRALTELYPGGLTQAKTAAERARTLDEIDAAYFGATGNSPEQVSASRAQLAQRLLREDPAAFREMVFAGLRALEQSSAASQPQPLPGVSGTNAMPPSVSVASNAHQARAGLPAPPDHLAAYGAFEKAANADLEKSVGSAIERALHQALPHSERAESAALSSRLSAAIRTDIEKALQGDRQLGEQVAQLLSSRRFDNETRTQVVRLINDRAQQLVPSAAKRALNDWTQATLAAHRTRTRSSAASASRADLSPAAGQGSSSSGLSVHTVPGAREDRDRAAASRAPNSQAQRSSRVDYRKLSDEQILDL